MHTQDCFPVVTFWLHVALRSSRRIFLHLSKNGILWHLQWEVSEFQIIPLSLLFLISHRSPDANTYLLLLSSFSTSSSRFHVVLLQTLTCRNKRNVWAEGSFPKVLSTVRRETDLVWLKNLEIKVKWFGPGDGPFKSEWLPLWGRAFIQLRVGRLGIGRAGG